MEQKDIYILGIESSCDETAASVVKNGRDVLSNIISSQISIHRKYGGVVPEIASRKHIEHIMPVIDAALEDAKVTLDRIDGVAVTYGPGLVGALLVGLSAAKALAWPWPGLRASRCWGSIIWKAMCLPILSMIKAWSRRSWRWWYPAGTRPC